MGCIGCTILQANPKRLPGFFFLFNILIIIYFYKYETIETHARPILSLLILAVGTVYIETYIKKVFNLVAWVLVIQLTPFPPGFATWYSIMVIKSVYAQGE